jgi:hypothetical protein
MVVLALRNLQWIGVAVLLRLGGARRASLASLVASSVADWAALACTHGSMGGLKNNNAALLGAAWRRHGVSPSSHPRQARAAASRNVCGKR